MVNDSLRNRTTGINATRSKKLADIGEFSFDDAHGSTDMASVIQTRSPMLPRARSQSTFRRTNIGAPPTFQNWQTSVGDASGGRKTRKVRTRTGRKSSKSGRKSSKSGKSMKKVIGTRKKQLGGKKQTARRHPNDKKKKKKNGNKITARRQMSGGGWFSWLTGSSEQAVPVVVSEKVNDEEEEEKENVEKVTVPEKVVAESEGEEVKQGEEA